MRPALSLRRVTPGRRRGARPRTGEAPVRQVSRDDLLAFLYRKVNRWDSVWWNGELISLAQALGRANDLPSTARALCSHDEVILPQQLEVEPAIGGSR
jgi:hypothetical protein